MLWHSLRHTYASILAAGGIREDVVAVLMGHERPGTTPLCTHLFADAFEGVEEALAAVLDVNEGSTDGALTTEHSEEQSEARSVENHASAGVLAG